MDDIKKDEHEKKIVCFDYLPSKNIYITGSNDKHIKVWTATKALIRSISFPDIINSVSFLNNNGDLIVGHQRKLSKINASS